MGSRIYYQVYLTKKQSAWEFVSFSYKANRTPGATATWDTYSTLRLLCLAKPSCFKQSNQPSYLRAASASLVGLNSLIQADTSPQKFDGRFSVESAGRRFLSNRDHVQPAAMRSRPNPFFIDLDACHRCETTVDSRIIVRTFSPNTKKDT